MAAVRIAILGALLLCSCTSLSSELRTAQLLYTDARYEESMLWLSELQTKTSAMSSEDLARFY